VLKPILLGAFVLASAALFQDAPRPTCNRCSSTYIPGSEIQSYLSRVPATSAVSDQQVRAVDIGKSHVDIGVVYRGKLNSGANQRPVAEHDQVSEVYHVIEGSATLMTGSDLTECQRRPPDNNAVKLLNGPSTDCTNIRNGTSNELKTGDVIVIPAGVGHWFTKIDDHIKYLMVRMDPDKVTPLKTEADSKKDLATPR
jgi:mannose-6-phosphate isomerase-like protein (cupin superfamily)